MLKKGEKVKIQRGTNTIEVEIIGMVNITTNNRWYEFNAPADYRIEENYIGKITDRAGNIYIGQVCKYLYINDNDEVFDTEIVSHI